MLQSSFLGTKLTKQPGNSEFSPTHDFLRKISYEKELLPSKVDSPHVFILSYFSAKFRGIDSHLNRRGSGICYFLDEDFSNKQSLVTPKISGYSYATNFPHRKGFSALTAHASSSKSKPKSKKVYMCSECGESFPQWWGECSNCGHENTLKPFFVSPGGGSPGGGTGGGGGPAARALGRVAESGVGRGHQVASPGRLKGSWVEDMDGGPRRLSDVTKEGSQINWRMTLSGDGGKELSRVLGGGIVPGSLILVGGDPGVGKSTLLLQVAGLLAEGGGEDGPAPVLYVSGEESAEQVGSRAERMGIQAEELYVYSATDMETILDWIQRLSPRAVVVDSIQTVYLAEATGSAGSTSQVRECATALLHAAKRSGIAIFLVGHVTKSGDIAGPRVLEHIVDVVLYMEGERLQSHRLVRGVKNRYGATDEVGVFEMAEEGLVAVANPSLLFLGERSASQSQSVAAASVAVVMQGTRPLLMEVQALCSPAVTPPGRRVTNGVDFQRMPLLFAVLTKQAKLALHKHDIFVNVVGGLQLKEPGADLAIIIAIASSFHEMPIPSDMAFVGEVGLHGEIRSVGQLDRRLGEAAKLGFKRCIIPANRSNLSKGKLEKDKKSIEAIECTNISEAIKVAIGWDCSEQVQD